MSGCCSRCIPRPGCGCPWAATASADDVSIEAAALREATEESGIPGLRLLPGPLALDRHRVWCHPPHSHHLDVEYGAVAPADVEAVISDESLDLRWFPVEEIPELSDEATRRLARRARDIMRAGDTFVTMNAPRARKGLDRQVPDSRRTAQDSREDRSEPPREVRQHR